MSKLVQLYEKLKKQDSSILYLIKSGIFYIALEDDALTLSELFNFKLTDLNQNTIKCGFPTRRVSYYSNLLNLNNVKFKIVQLDEAQSEIKFSLPSDIKNSELIQKVLDINFDEITFKEAFFILQDLQNEFKQKE